MSDHFKWQLRELFRSEIEHSREIRLRKHDPAFTPGINDSMIYCVESGRVKEFLLTPEGEAIALSTHGAGDIFGELSLCGERTRCEMAIAVQDSTIRKMPSRVFLDAMRREDMFEGMVKYLAERLSGRQQIRSHQSVPFVPDTAHFPFEFARAGTFSGNLQ